MAEMNLTSAVGTEQKQIHVKLSTLRKGIGTVFSGVLTMLEALDTETAKKLVEGFVLEDDGKEERTNEANPSESGTVAAAGAVSSDAPAVGDDVPDELTAQKESKGQTASASSVTRDDITKIIVQKLKKDRSNNERIGAILKAYGVARVSDLPESRYEAFLTDISQL